MEVAVLVFTNASNNKNIPEKESSINSVLWTNGEMRKRKAKSMALKCRIELSGFNVRERAG